MRGRQEKKVPGGKLVQVEVEFDDTIKSVMISGDFFAHPEESIHLLEKSFESLAKDADFLSHIREQTRDVLLVGLDAETLSQLVEEAVRCGE